MRFEQQMRTFQRHARISVSEHGFGPFSRLGRVRCLRWRSHLIGGPSRTTKVALSKTETTSATLAKLSRVEEMGLDASSHGHRRPTSRRASIAKAKNRKPRYNGWGVLVPGQEQARQQHLQHHQLRLPTCASVPDCSSPLMWLLLRQKRACVCPAAGRWRLRRLRLCSAMTLTAERRQEAPHRVPRVPHHLVDLQLA